ncbi:MAG: Lrp/AsnC family transcriptional regulator [Aquificota bacterium]|nr:Lrp/AsnC family transcriptional regulator [Aquificota bacterium]
MLEADVLRAVQEHIPIRKEPFRAIAEELGSDEETVLSVLKTLKEKGIIRQISPIYDARRAGYDSALVAFRVDRNRLEEVADRVNHCPGVSHNYERDPHL